MMSGARRIIVNEAGLPVSVPAWQAAPPRKRASSLSAQTERTEATPSRATTQGRREDTGGEEARQRLPALFRIFRRNPA